MAKGHSNAQDLTGQTINEFVFIRRAADRGDQKAWWVVVCPFCKREFEARAGNIKSGNTTSCGCERKRQRQERLRTHGLSNTRAYHAWADAKQRATNENRKEAKWYREKGVTMCQRYLDSFEAFLEDHGQPATGFTIDRIDGDKGYWCGKCEQCKQNGWPANLRWATQKEQMQNMSRNVWMECWGERKVMSEWARDERVIALRITEKNLYWRHKQGWSDLEALTTAKK